VRPHAEIFPFLLFAATEDQAEDGDGSADRPTDLAAPQTATEGAYGPYEILAVLPSQLFLPDRKKGLASVKPFFEIRFRLVSHLIGCHDRCSFSPSARFQLFTRVLRQVFHLYPPPHLAELGADAPAGDGHHDGV
jgi:hypothetical protein